MGRSFIVLLVLFGIGPFSPARAKGDRKLACGFDVPRTKSLKPTNWQEFGTTSSDRKKFVEKGEGNGGIRCAQTFKATEGAVFYRRYDSGKTPKGAIKVGRSWTLERWPSGSKYRRAMAICAGWNDLAKEVECRIKKGKIAYVYIGPGESVSADTCKKAGEGYPESADLQVTFHSDPKDVCDFR